MQPKNLSDRLFFDIETTAHPNADEFLGLGPLTPDDLTVADLKKVLSDANFSGAGSKSELIERAQGDETAMVFLKDTLTWAEKERNDAALEKAPLDPDLGTIRAIGWASGDGMLEVRIVENDPGMIEDLPIAMSKGDGDMIGLSALFYADEGDMIEDFWILAEKHRLQLVGANILNFDLPFLMRRSMELNIRVPKDLSLRRYQVEPICDTMQILSHWGAFKYKSLKFMCKRYGIEIPMPDVDGSQVKDMDNPTLAKYVASDVFCTRELWKKMDGVYWPEAVQFPNPHAG